MHSFLALNNSALQFTYLVTVFEGLFPIHCMCDHKFLMAMAMKQMKKW